MTNLKVTRSWMMTSGIQRNYYKKITSFEVLDEKKVKYKNLLVVWIDVDLPLAPISLSENIKIII